MSDFRTDGVHAPQWREHYQAVLLEIDPRKSLKLIAVAHSAILDQIEDNFSKASKADFGGLVETVMEEIPSHRLAKLSVWFLCGNFRSQERHVNRTIEHHDPSTTVRAPNSNAHEIERWPPD